MTKISLKAQLKLYKQKKSLDYQYRKNKLNIFYKMYMKTVLITVTGT